MQVENKRLELLDAVKGLAIILMVFGHCIQYGSGNLYLESNAFFENPIFKIIYSFHMPLFMLVSGYLFFNSMSKYTFKETIQRKIKQLLLPIITYWIVDSILFCMTNKIIAINAMNIIWNLWFLWALFYSSLIVLFINKFLNNNLLIYLLVCLLLFFVPNKYNFDLYCYMIPYFILGFLFNRYKIMERIKEKVNIIFWISIFVYRGGYAYITLIAIFIRQAIVF